MRYVLGVSIEDKITHELCEGIIGYDSMGFAAIYNVENRNIILRKNNISEEEKDASFDTYIYYTIEEVKKAVSEYAKAFRRDDCWLNKWAKSKKIRRFYPLKVDSPKFPFKIDKMQNHKKDTENKKLARVSLKEKFINIDNEE